MDIRVNKKKRIEVSIKSHQAWYVSGVLFLLGMILLLFIIPKMFWIIIGIIAGVVLATIIIAFNYLLLLWGIKPFFRIKKEQDKENKLDEGWTKK